MGAGSFAAGWLHLCFPNFALVLTRHGVVKISELEIGEEIKVMQKDNTIGWSPVIGWAHRDPEQDATFVELSTSSRKITLSPDHLLPVVKMGDDKHHHVKAGTVVKGDCVLQMTGDGFQTMPVTSLRTVESRGIYAPLTMAGTVVADGIAASCYASVPSHSAAHAALAPVRAAFELRPKTVAKHHEDKDGKVFTGASNYVDRLGRVGMKVLHPRHRVSCTV